MKQRWNIRELVNPLIVASCPATEDLPRLTTCARAGAGAAILKSCATVGWNPEGTAGSRRFYATSLGLWGNSTITSELLSPEEALYLLKAEDGLKPMLLIPSVAGPNLEPELWLETLRLFERLEPVAIQLDLFYLGEDLSLPVSLQRLRTLLKILLAKVTIPLIPKLNQELRPGAVLETVAGLELGGLSLLDSLRFSIPDHLQPAGYPMVPQWNHSGSLFGRLQLPVTLDYLLRLRGDFPGFIIAGGGAENACDLQTLLAAGADAVQVATPLLRHGAPWLRKVLSELAEEPRKDEVPHGIDTVPRRAMVQTGECTRCRVCLEQMMCSHIVENDDGFPVVGETCPGCGFCVSLCSRGAISLVEVSR